MKIIVKNQTTSPRTDPADLFKKLGLTIADERPIMAGWKEANRHWRQERATQIAAHHKRIESHLKRYCRGGKRADYPFQIAIGRRRAVWCIELRRRFRSLTEAANFVGRRASHICQSLKRGVKCGKYHWAEFDEKRHRDCTARRKSGSSN